MDAGTVVTGDAGAETSTRSATCVAVDDALRGEVERVGKDVAFDTLFEWKSEQCTAVFLTHGPSKLDDHRVFRIGSITKSYIAVLALDLVAKKELALDDRVDSQLPDTPPSVSAVTVRQLLQHTSGIFNYTDVTSFMDEVAKHPRRVWLPRELVDIATAQAPYVAPGGGWHYSNTGYILLGMILEKAGKAPLARLLRDRVLNPHGLTETFLEGGEEVKGVLVPGYDAEGRDVTTRYDASSAWAAGAMIASTADLTRFIEALGNGTLVSPDLRAAMLTPVATPQKGLSYGLGVFLAANSITGGGLGIGHGGDIYGYHSWGWYFPDKRTTVVAAMNSDVGNANTVVAGALSVLFPSPP